MIRASFLALLLLLLAGCGFHLRDALLLPPDLGPVRVQARDPDGPLAQQLQQALQRAGATVVDPAAAVPAGEDDATLRIVSERWGDTPISIDQFCRCRRKITA